MLAHCRKPARSHRPCPVLDRGGDDQPADVVEQHPGKLLAQLGVQLVSHVEPLLVSVRDDLVNRPRSSWTRVCPASWRGWWTSSPPCASHQSWRTRAHFGKNQTFQKNLENKVNIIDGLYFLVNNNNCLYKVDKDNVLYKSPT